MTTPSSTRRAFKYAGAFFGLVVGHYVATNGALVLATVFRGHIDAPKSAFAARVGDLLFRSFLLLCEPLDRYWLNGGNATSATAWMLANGAIWAACLIVAFQIVRVFMARSKHAPAPLPRTT